MVVNNFGDKKIVEFFRQLGITTDQTNAYLFLMHNGPSTVLDISRGLETGRTKLYPLLEDMINQNLIRENKRHYGSSYEITTTAQLNALVRDKEVNVRYLRDQLDPVANLISDAIGKHAPLTKISNFEDTAGLQQIFWNMVESKQDYFVFWVKGTEKLLGDYMCSKIRSALNDIKVYGKILSNEEAVSSFAGGKIQSRLISPSEFKIEQFSLIYSDTVGLLPKSRKNVRSCEIKEPLLASQQKALFLSLWEKAG